MEDQHKKIKGYRDLSPDEIDLMNRIKSVGSTLSDLMDEVYDLRNAKMHSSCEGVLDGLTSRQCQESIRCLDIAKQNLQQGQMWFVRAVALPDSF